MGYFWISLIGGIIIWIFKGFKKTTKRQLVSEKWSFEIGFLFVIILIFFLL